MADTKFKVGDRVVGIANHASWPVRSAHGYVFKLDTIGRQVGVVFDRADFCHAWDGKKNRGLWVAPSEIAHFSGKQKPDLAPKYILQYELDADPFEFFATEKEARKRIAELAERTDLKRDSIRLIEIKKIRTVKLGVKISISK